MQNIDFSFAQDPNTLSLAVIYGMIPAILWVFYWLREDTEHKRRKGLLTALFFLGAISVIPTLPVQKLMLHVSADDNVLNVLWAASEELIKFLVFTVVILRTTANTIIDPVDYPVYIMVAALGFAGFENALYFLGPLQAENMGGLLLSGSTRFLGTTLLHAATSSIIGISIGFAYFKSKRTTVLYSLVGIALAITAHSAFNYFIVQNNEQNFFQIFSILWVAATIIMICLELLRRMGSIEIRKKKEHVFFEHIEELFNQVCALAGMSAADPVPLAEGLKAKNFSETGPEFKKFHTLISSLRSLYAGFMISEGTDRKKVPEISKNMVPETIAPNAIAGLIAMLKGEIEHELDAAGGRAKGVQFAGEAKPMAMPTYRPVAAAPAPLPRPAPIANAPVTLKPTAETIVAEPAVPKTPIEVKVTPVFVPTDFVPVKAGTATAAPAQTPAVVAVAKK